MECRDSQVQALLLEIVDHQKRLLAQAARLLEIQRQEHAQARESLEQAGSVLRAAAADLARGGQAFGDDALARIADQGGRVLEESLGEALGRVRLGAERAGHALTQAGEAAVRSTASSLRAQALAGWKSLAFLVAGGLFLVAGTGLWAWHQLGQARLHAVEAELGRRLAEADLVKCGDGLCAAVDPAAAGQGAGGRYRQVLRRSDAGTR